MKTADHSGRWRSVKPAGTNPANMTGSARGRAGARPRAWHAPCEAVGLRRRRPGGEVRLEGDGGDARGARCAPTAVAAEEPSQEDLSKRLDALQQELAVVKRQLEVKQEEDARDKDRTGIVTVDSQGFQLRSRDNHTYRLRLRGYVQSDGRFFVGNDED